MKTLILAAGRGSRMKCHTDDRPKGLVELDGRSLVERMVSGLNVAGIHDIGLVTGYKREMWDPLGLPGFHNAEWANTNMVSSLVCARMWLRKEPVLVSYSDIFTSPANIKTLIDAPAHDLTMVYDIDWLSLWSARNENVLDDAESFRLDGDRIVEIGNKAGTIEEIQGQYMGLFKLTPKSWAVIEDILKELPEEKARNLFVTDLFQLLIKRGFPIHGVAIAGDWGEADTETDLQLYEKLAAQNHYGDWFYNNSTE